MSPSPSHVTITITCHHHHHCHYVTITITMSPSPSPSPCHHHHHYVTITITMSPSPSPSLCHHHHHYVTITITMSSPSLCHHRHYVITITITIAITVTMSPSPSLCHHVIIITNILFFFLVAIKWAIHEHVRLHFIKHCANTVCVYYIANKNATWSFSLILRLYDTGQRCGLGWGLLCNSIMRDLQVRYVLSCMLYWSTCATTYLGSCGKNRPGNHTINPKPLEKLKIVDGGPFFSHDSILASSPGWRAWGDEARFHQRTLQARSRIRIRSILYRRGWLLLFPPTICGRSV